MVDRPRRNSPTYQACIGGRAERRAGPPLCHCSSCVLRPQAARRFPAACRSDILSHCCMAVPVGVSLTGQGDSRRQNSHNLSPVLQAGRWGVLVGAV